jgi:alkylated DNA repair dioxygenase AlkB
MGEYTGETLEPTYSYLRVYKNGDILHRHTDRNACEYSVSITLKREQADDIWPLCLETDEVHKVCLEEGDGLIYKGVENSHWRDKFDGERLAQVFLHYVRR